MPSDVHFLSRNNAFESERRVILAKEGVLRVIDAKGETRIPLHEIGLVELSAESSLAYDIVFTCQIYRKRAWFPALTLKSKLYRGPDGFADRRGDYRQFLAALHAQIAANAWPIRTQVTARPAALLLGLVNHAHWAILIWGAAFLASAIGLAFVDPPWAADIPEVSLGVASLAALVYLGSKFSGLRAAYGPWPYDPVDVPAALLPEPQIRD